MGLPLYDWGGLNVWLFHVINDPHTAWIDALMLLCTDLGDHGNFPIVLALSTVSGFITAQRCSKSDAIAWLSVLSVFSLAYVVEGQLIGFVKPWLDFPRPPLALPKGSVHIVGQVALRHSLPSGHSAFAMLVTASLWPVSRPPVRLILALYALCVGISRVSLGAHFPADVLAGFALSLLLVRMLQTLLARLGAVIGEGRGSPAGPSPSAPSP